MDILKQTKLTREEWNSIEKPLPEDEERILELICKGYENVNIRINRTQTMFSFTKLQRTPEMEYFLFEKYFNSAIKKLADKYGSLSKDLKQFKVDSKKIKKLKSVDALRVQHVDSVIQNEKKKIHEFHLLEYCEKVCYGITKKTTYLLELYTLIQWNKNHIYILKDLRDFVNVIIKMGKEKTSIMSVIAKCTELIEQNHDIIKKEDNKLFDHQKELFTHYKMALDPVTNETIANDPKMVLYIAPTGTGKTLSPLGLATQYRVLFVCVARHIGLALARSAICAGKKVAFAFGCSTADDIRLHYYAASDYTINKRSGGIGKVDNSKGENVEIMICDVQSYQCAMYYMMAFNDPNKIITYWDEPTISMDYETHGLHEIIHSNWCENKIPNIVLSCATLPKEHEIQDVLQDYRAYFEKGSVHTIISYDCKKSIPIINTSGYSYLLHTECKEYDLLKERVEYCESNKTLLRYFDLKEIVKFIGMVHVFNPNQSLTEEDSSDDDGDDGDDGSTLLQRRSSVDNSRIKPVIPERYKIANYFSDISEITMDSVKNYYLKLLQNIEPIYWPKLYRTMTQMKQPKFKSKTVGQIRRSYSMQNSSENKIDGELKTLERANSDAELNKLKEKYLEKLKGTLLTTADAHTLTDGPTIYIVDDVANIAKFYIDNSDISQKLLDGIMEKISKNQILSKKISEMEEKIEEKLKKADNTDKSQEPARKGGSKPKIKEIANDETDSLNTNITSLLNQIELVELDNEYIPNKPDHQHKWAPDYNNRSFVPKIDGVSVKEIMSLDIDESYKVLTLMGVGVLTKQEHSNYEEVVKRLAQQQKLFVILTTSDYIYGTNYQFCHGFIGDDLENMTQQKILQSMGRIGRNNIQQDYTVRFRKDEYIEKLFKTPENNLEAINMNVLFCR